MSEENAKLVGPDFAEGVAVADLTEGGMILGQVAGEAVVLARNGGALFAIGAECTHYHGPLAEGVLVADTVRCPWHHACFSLRSGEALHAPALDPVACWRVEQHEGTIYVREKLEPARRPARADAGPESVVIIGGGAGGNAAAEMLRREGYAGRVTMLSADDARPYDRPNLSKDYLAGTAPEEWIPLRPPEFYAEHGIELKLGAHAAAIDAKAREVRLADGSRHHYGALLLATGATPVRLDIPGGNLPHIHYLRTLADSRALIASATTAHRRELHRRELHRSRGRGVTAQAGARSACRGTRNAPNGKRARPGSRRPRAQGPRGARCGLSISAPHQLRSIGVTSRCGAENSSPPILWSLASGCGPRSHSPSRPASQSIAASPSTHISRRAFLGYGPPGTSQDGPTG